MQIALLSDTHLAPGFPPLDVNLGAVRSWVADNGIAETIHLGDISADGIDHPQHLAHAHELLRDWPGRLHVLPGNHDVGDAPTSASMAAYARLFGADRWLLRIAGWTMIGLNAQLLGRGDRLDAAQDRWLDNVVRETAGPTGLFLHKPLCRTALDDGDSHHRYVRPAARAPLWRRMANVDLRFVAAGHTHQTRRLHIGGIEHLWMPSAAFTLPDGMQETIGVKQVAVTLLTLEGATCRFETVEPPRLIGHDLADLADLYPEHADAIRAARRD